MYCWHQSQPLLLPFSACFSPPLPPAEDTLLIPLAARRSSLLRLIGKSKAGRTGQMDSWRLSDSTGADRTSEEGVLEDFFLSCGWAEGFQPQRTQRAKRWRKWGGGGPQEGREGSVECRGRRGLGRERGTGRPAVGPYRALRRGWDGIWRGRGGLGAGEEGAWAVGVFPMVGKSGADFSNGWKKCGWFSNGWKNGRGERNSRDGRGGVRGRVWWRR